MAFLRDLGSGNPFATPIGQLIENATDGAQSSEDWSQFIQICDLINASEEGAKDAVKALRKRLTSSGKSYQCIVYTLTLLETCVKNCGNDGNGPTSKFHQLFSSSSFLHDLTKVMAPKYEPPPYLQDKILVLIQTWNDTFKNNPDMSDIQKCFKDLQSKGIQFPLSDLDKQVPILTPAKHGVDGVDGAANTSSPSNTSTSISTPSKHSAKPFSPSHMAKSSKYQILDETEVNVPDESAHSAPVPGVASGGAGHGASGGAGHQPAPLVITAERMQKLKSEFEIVIQNRKVLSDMLQEYSNKPNEATDEDIELIEELNKTCRDMQTRVVQLIAKIQDERLTGDLLIMNDGLNNVFLRYDRYKRQTLDQSEKREDADGEAALLHRTVPTANLIDFDSGASSQPHPPVADETDITIKMAANEIDDFSSIARRGELEGPSTIRKSLNAERDSDFNEMEDWLKTEKADEQGEGTTEAFDKFLAGRSSEGDFQKKNNLLDI